VAALATISFIVAMPRSAMPRREAAVPAPVYALSIASLVVLEAEVHLTYHVQTFEAFFLCDACC
jgi:hypothetical protein